MSTINILGRIKKRKKKKWLEILVFSVFPFASSLKKK
jgi:hypothetical protein